MEECESIAIVCENWMTAACTLLSFASFILPVSLYCLALCFAGCKVGKFDLPKGCHVQRLRAGDKNMDWATQVMMTYHLWSVMRKVRFVAIALKVCCGLAVLMYWTLGWRLLLLSMERWALIVEIQTPIWYCFLGLQVVPGTKSLPRFR